MFIFVKEAALAKLGMFTVLAGNVARHVRCNAATPRCNKSISIHALILAQVAVSP